MQQDTKPKDILLRVGTIEFGVARDAQGEEGPYCVTDLRNAVEQPGLDKRKLAQVLAMVQFNFIQSLTLLIEELGQQFKREFEGSVLRYALEARQKAQEVERAQAEADRVKGGV